MCFSFIISLIYDRWQQQFWNINFFISCKSEFHSQFTIRDCIFYYSFFFVCLLGTRRYDTIMAICRLKAKTNWQFGNSEECKPLSCSFKTGGRCWEKVCSIKIYIENQQNRSLSSIIRLGCRHTVIRHLLTDHITVKALQLLPYFNE